MHRNAIVSCDSEFCCAEVLALTVAKNRSIAADDGCMRISTEATANQLGSFRRMPRHRIHSCEGVSRLGRFFGFFFPRPDRRHSRNAHHPARSRCGSNRRTAGGPQCHVVIHEKKKKSPKLPPKTSKLRKKTLLNGPLKTPRIRPASLLKNIALQAIFIKNN